MWRAHRREIGRCVAEVCSERHQVGGGHRSVTVEIPGWVVGIEFCLGQDHILRMPAVLPTRNRGDGPAQRRAWGTAKTRAPPRTPTGTATVAKSCHECRAAIFPRAGALCCLRRQEGTGGVDRAQLCFCRTHESPTRKQPDRMRCTGIHLAWNHDASGIGARGSSRRRTAAILAHRFGKAWSRTTW